jgi:hypothetical protein
MTVTQPSEEVHMRNDPNPSPTAAGTQPAKHHSTFAEGESNPAAHPEEEHVGTFAEGECEPEAHPEEEHVGSFAEVKETPASPS